LRASYELRLQARSVPRPREDRIGRVPGNVGQF